VQFKIGPVPIIIGSSFHNDNVPTKSGTGHKIPINVVSTFPNSKYHNPGNEQLSSYIRKISAP
jgi:hypothetical protein